LVESRFSAFENKIINLLSSRNKNSVAINNTKCIDSPLNVLVDDDETCSCLNNSSPDKCRSWQSERISTNTRNVHHIPDTVDAQQHGNVAEEVEKLESVPNAWDNMIDIVKKTHLVLRLQSPTRQKGILFIAVFLWPTVQWKGSSVPADDIIVNA
jgi:hypothetical protein